MGREFKTKENTLKKQHHNNHSLRRMQNIPSKNKKEAEQNSASYHTYALDQLKVGAEKSFQMAKTYAVKRMRNNNQKKNLKQEDFNPQQTAISNGRSRSHLGSRIKMRDVQKTKMNSYAAGKSLAVNKTRKNLFITQAQKASKTIRKITMNMLNSLKNAIPVKWKIYIALIGGGTVIIMGFLIVMFGSIFGGDDGTTYAGAFIMPFDNAQTVSITDDYGWRIHPVTGEESFHYGIDFGTPGHCEIKAVAIGEVTFAGDFGTYGNTVILKHEIYGDVIYSMYAHLSEIKVEVGQMLMQGEVIGLEGGDPVLDPNPGSSTGHHLHFGMMNERMEYVNPGDYINVN